jgi:hypothetical protein
MTNPTEIGAPTVQPPSASTTASSSGTAVGVSAPSVTDAQLHALIEDSAPEPSMLPPAEVGAAAAGAAAAVWRNNVKIDGLWSIDETRNAWVSVAGIGWRKVYNGRDGAFQALVSLLSQARQANRPVNLREEADGIYEVYLW